MMTFATSLVENLKGLNAKERDHLARFAYLGVADAYENNTTRWLSDEMIKALQPQLEKTHLRPGAPCVFAGIDYHLDWLSAALFLTCKKESARLLDDSSSCDNTSLRPITGSVEDLDLLVAFADDQDHVLLLCIEAKGVAPFKKPQLARKIVRLNRILVASGARKEQLGCKLVLMAPRKPAFAECLEYVKDFDPYLASESVLIGRGQDFFVPLAGFPETLQRVNRTGPATVTEKFSCWEPMKRCMKR